MGFMKEAWDILKENPEALEMVKQNAAALYNQLKPRFLAGWFPKSATLFERIEAVEGICDFLLTEPQFPNKFRDRMDYFEFLLRTIMETVEAKERGILLENFYLKDEILYFPRAYQHIKSKAIRAGKNRFFGWNSYYTFYSLKVYKRETLFGEFQNQLDMIVKTGGGAREDEEFKRYIKSQDINLSVLLQGLWFYPDNGSYQFADSYASSGHRENRPTLTFSNASDARNKIARDLKYVLSFQIL
jgi:hypothetical protein